MRSVVCRLMLVLAVLAAGIHSDLSTLSATTVVPDFTGRWKFDGVKTSNIVRESPGRFVALTLGDECTIKQTSDILTLYIVAGGLKIEATYRLDGKPSTNQSPGPPGQAAIPIISTARWAADVLHITTNSESVLDGTKVPVESLRRIWLTAEGNLATERRGTPAQVVSAGWSVYRRMQGEPVVVR
ncbi:MAG: hypothetical protein ABIP90_07180 [Vicinamibacterales bacterium]